ARADGAPVRRRKSAVPYVVGPASLDAAACHALHVAGRHIAGADGFDAGADRSPGFGVRKLSGADDGGNQRLHDAPQLAARADAEALAYHAARLGPDRLRSNSQPADGPRALGRPEMLRDAAGFRRRVLRHRLVARPRTRLIVAGSLRVPEVSTSRCCIGI